MRIQALYPGIVGILAAVLLASTLATAVMAADGAGDPPADPTAVPLPSATPDPTPTPVENGEIVIDPTFIPVTPEPQGAVAGATGRPRMTPPPTDTNRSATTSGTSLQVLLVLGVAGLFVLLAASGRPAGRRR